jgi:outer membrane protein OmpA-like peptidoglycan-associated protein
MLQANAVDSSVIGVAGWGERDLLVRTGEHVDEVRNRWVKIVVR